MTEDFDQEAEAEAELLSGGNHEQPHTAGGDAQGNSAANKFGSERDLALKSEEVTQRALGAKRLRQTGRPPGRPPKHKADEPTKSVSAHVPLSDYARLSEIANERSTEAMYEYTSMMNEKLKDVELDGSQRRAFFKSSPPPARLTVADLVYEGVSKILKADDAKRQKSAAQAQALPEKHSESSTIALVHSSDEQQQSSSSAAQPSET
jgi:hypothetical protein